jgi:hypothetical protein
MNETVTADAKVNKPHAFFDEPHQVVVDPALSHEQKKEALDALEQDARQMAVAAGEGMAGGEPALLHDVLNAQELLDLPPVARAYDLVVNDLRSRLEGTQESRSLVQVALTAVEAVMAATASQSPASNAVPTAGSAAGIEDEIAREKLDP